MANMKLSSSSTSKTNSKTVKEEYKQLSGPKVDYSKYFMNAPKVPEYYKPDVMTEADMLKSAQDRLQGLYDTYIKNSQIQRDTNIKNLQSAIGDLMPVYQQRVDAIGQNYKINERNIGNNALSKGMGRSSYVQDVKRENSDNMSRDINSVNLDKKLAENKISREIENENSKYSQDENKFKAQEQHEVNKLVAQMQKEQDAKLFDAQKYNNSLYDNYSKLLLNQQKHNLSVQKYIDSLNVKKVTVTTTSSVTTRNTYKAETGVDRERVMNLWGTMSDGQKMKYVQQNKGLLQKGAPDLLYEFSLEATKIGLNTAMDRLGISNIKNIFGY